MPLAADPYASNNAAGFSGKPFVYFYNGLNEINLRFDVTYIKTGEPNIASECYEFCVDDMFDYIANVARDLKINLNLNQMDEMKLVFADWVFFENWAYEEFWDF